MNINFNKEILVVSGIVMLSFGIGLSFFGSHLWNGKPLEIQDHDTYYIVPKSAFLVLVFILLSLIVFLGRWISTLSITRNIAIVVCCAIGIMLLGLFHYCLVRLSLVNDLYPLIHSDSFRDRIDWSLLQSMTAIIVISVLSVINVVILFKNFKNAGGQP